MVSPAANAVYAYTSAVATLGVKDDADAAEVTLGSMRLLVNVSVPV